MRSFGNEILQGDVVMNIIKEKAEKYIYNFVPDFNIRFIFLWFFVFFNFISKHRPSIYFKKCSFNSFLKILFPWPLPSCFIPILSSAEKRIKKILFSMDFNLRLRIIHLILISLHIFTWFMSSAYQSHFRTIVLIEEIYKSCHFRKHV